MKFCVTFGQRFAYDKHKTFEKAHPNGYVVINADNENEARQKAFDFLGSEWAFMYPEEEFIKDECFTMYTRGVLEEIK